jgi:hypothetical protein
MSKSTDPFSDDATKATIAELHEIIRDADAVITCESQALESRQGTKAGEHIENQLADWMLKKADAEAQLVALGESPTPPRSATVQPPGGK